MNKKMQITKDNSPIKNAQDITTLVEKKLLFFQDVIQKTILHSQKNKMLDILGVSDLTACINTLNNISDKMKTMSDNITQLPTDNIVSNLQALNNELSSLLKNYGTESFEDLLTICFGNNNAIVTTDEELLKYDLLKKYFHPTQYKVVTLKKTEKELDGKFKTSFFDEFITENSKNFDCTDVSLNSKQFHMKVYGLKIYIYHSAFNKHLLIYGIVDDIILQFLNNKFINNAMFNIKNNLPNNGEFKGDSFERFFSSLTLKDYLIMKHAEVYNKFIGCQTQYKLLKQKT